MNLSIYIKLWNATVFGKVKIQPKYKHLEYMNDNNFVSPINDSWVEIAGYPLPTHSNWYTITSDGKAALWKKGDLLLTRIIAIAALIISVFALAVNYFSKF